MGCGGNDIDLPSEGDEETGTSTTTSTTTSTSTSTSASTTTTSDSDADSDSDSGSGSPGICGDGIVDEGEECDDDSAQCLDGCVLACRLVMQADVVDPEHSIWLDDLAIAPDGSYLSVGSIGIETLDGSDVLIARIPEDLGTPDLDSYDHDGDDEYGIALAIADDGSRWFVAGQGFGLDEPLVLRSEGDGEVALVDAPAIGSEGGGVAAVPGGVVVSGTASIATAYYGIWAAGYDASGHQWDATWTSTAPEVPSHPHGGRIAASPLGDVYVMGTRPAVSGTFGIYDPVVVAFGPEGGEPQWSYSEDLESTNVDVRPRDIVVDATGRVVALFTLAHGSLSTIHFLLRAFDPDGRPVLSLDSASLDLDGGEDGTALLVDADGRIVVFAMRIGAAAGEGDGTTQVLAFDPDGTVVCSERTSELVGQINGAVIDSAGDYVVAGTVYQSQDIGHGSVARFRGL